MLPELALLLMGATPPECSGVHVDNASFSTLLDEAERAYADFDNERFQTLMDDASFQVVCLEQVASPGMAAQYHQLQGLRQYGTAEEERAAQAFAAARSASPGQELPADLVPEGHAVRDLYGQIPLDSGARSLMPVPVSGQVLLDGTPATERPEDWPTLFQLQSAEGAITQTSYLLPGELLPSYPGVMPEAPPLARVGWIKTRRQLWLLSGAAATASLAGVSYGMGAWNAAIYEQQHPDWQAADFERQERKTNGLVLGSAGLGLASAAMLGTSFLVVEW
ncbi:MAG: hypothetical protein VX899_26950 [Myxococcota bacterium]|nr:hypothetical protein [Myxococcota bacterium]